MMQRPRMQQTMPEDRSGWHHIDAGPHLEILFHPDRRLAGREPDQIERPSIVVAVAGKREQALRFDPFSIGAHYHIRPGLAEQIPLPVAEAQSPLDATMAFFEKPLRFRGLLALAEEDDVAAQLRTRTQPPDRATNCGTVIDDPATSDEFSGRWCWRRGPHDCPRACPRRQERNDRRGARPMRRTHLPAARA